MKVDLSKNIKYTSMEYRELISRLRQEIYSVIPPKGTVIIVSKGDEKLLELEERRAWHFPRLKDGRYAGHYPAKSTDAIRQLEELRAEGGEFLVVPSTAYWWFNHYPGFKHHLERRYRLFNSRGDTCLIFALSDSKVKTNARSNRAIIEQAIEDAAAIAAIPIEIREQKNGGKVEKACQLPCEGIPQTPNSFNLIEEHVRRLTLAGDFNAAQETLLNVTKSNNVGLRAYIKLAETSLALGDLKVARAAARYVVGTDPNHSKAWKILAAIRDLKRIPAETRELIDLAKLERAEGNEMLADHFLIAADSLALNDYELNLELAQIEIKRRQIGVAERRLTRVVNLQPPESEVLNELMKLFCVQVEDYEIHFPGRPIEPALLQRFLKELLVPGRLELVSAEINLRIAETMARINQVEPAIASLTFALSKLDFTSEILRDFTVRLLCPVVNNEYVIPFREKATLVAFLTQLGNGFAATNESYKAQACYHLAVAADKETCAARFNLAMHEMARGDIFCALEHFEALRKPGDDCHVDLIAWPTQAGFAWPHSTFKHKERFEKVKSSGANWPKITVITPSFNQATYMEETLLSVLNQDYPVLEYVVVDRGSTDPTLEVLRRYQNYFAKLVIESSEGRAKAINKGLQLSTGEIVLWLDSGDMLAPGALFMLALSYLEEGADLITGFCLEHSEHRFQSITQFGVTPANFNVEYMGDLFDSRSKLNYFNREKAVFSRRILDAIGGKLDDRLSFAMDYELWMRCAQAGGRLSLISWPVGLCQKKAPAEEPSELTDYHLEHSRVRDRFVVTEPTLSRKLEIRQRVGWSLAQPVPEIAVVSTMAFSIFSPDTASELKKAFAKEGLNVSFHDDLEAAALRNPAAIILLFHLYKEQDAVQRLRAMGYQGPVAGWFLNNHHLIFDNFEAAKGIDICVPGHAFASDYLRSRHYIMRTAAPPCSIQWSGEEAAKLFQAHGLLQRSNLLYGDFIQHTIASKRDAFIRRLVSAGIKRVNLLDKDLEMTLEERFKTLASHKASICLPLNRELSGTLFDALLTGQIPIVPPDLCDLDQLIPRKLQNRLPILRMSDYTVDAVRKAHARAIELFDQQGKAGTTRRHRFALRDHMFVSRIATIISEMRTIAGVFKSQNPFSYQKFVRTSGKWAQAKNNLLVESEFPGENLFTSSGNGISPENGLTRPLISLPPVAKVTPAFFSGSDQFLDKRYHKLFLSSLDQTKPLPGVSLVTGCMNREKNLLKVLGSWLATDTDEIIIVDWSSTSELSQQLSKITDPRVKILRIEGEKSWIAAHALNVGLRFATREVVFRIDCDIELSPDFLKINTPRPGEFVRGFWKSGLEQGGEGQQFIHGTFGAFKKDLREANYYDERILTYGWEDSELYQRLSHDLGLAAKQIDPRSLRHIEQSEEQRIAHQDVLRNRFLGKYQPTEFEGAKNKFYTIIEGAWSTVFRPQDYEILKVSPGMYRGLRITEKPERNPDSEQLAELLASKQLTGWAAATTPELADLDGNSLGLAKAFRDAHRVNNSARVLAGFTGAKNVHLIHCEPGPCQVALLKTIDALQRHYSKFNEQLIIVEAKDKGLLEENLEDGLKNIVSVDSELMLKLTEKMRAKKVASLNEFVEQAFVGEGRALSLSLSIDSIAEEVCRNAEKMCLQLAGTYQPPFSQVLSSCLVTSLYDEQNLLRLIEYLTCVVMNLRVFERITIYYESTTGILSDILQKIIEILNIPAGQLLVLPYPKRPTFEGLFSIKTMLPQGTLVAVANADIAFDASFSKIKQIDLSRNIVVLSRRDVINNGKSARLIRFENGIPNTFSADAWVFSTPFDHDFFLDYPIGSFHCDSFLNHQISRSSLYNAVNPCLDVAAFHLHDDRFNSSAEKQTRDAEIIKRNYSIERKRNGDVDPIKGVSWLTAEGATLVPAATYYQSWKPKGLIMQFAGSSRPTFGHLLLLHFFLMEKAAYLHDVRVVVKVRESDLEGPLGRLLLRYRAHFNSSDFLIDVVDTGNEGIESALQATLHRKIPYADLAEWVISGASQKIHEFLAWPAVEGIELLRCEVTGNLSTQQVLGIFTAIEDCSSLITPLTEFFKALPDFSPEKQIISPFVIPRLLSPPRASSQVRKSKKKPSVSFITSLFQGRGFLPGFLENVCVAAQNVGGEIIIIDANPDDQDAQEVKEFLNQHTGARQLIEYVKLERDPGLYECWRIGIERAKAGLITNANVDDRRCPQHTARLVQLLHKHPEYAGACGSISCVTSDGTGGWFTLYENQLWFFGEGINEISFEDLYRLNERGEVISRDVMHCMPVWRRSLHERYGFFDEAKYGTSADWAFWLKCAKEGEKFIFDEGAFGQYFLNPNSHNRRNDSMGVKELRIIKDFLDIEQYTYQKQ